MRKFILSILSIILSVAPALAQDVEMADTFRAEGKIYVVIVVMSIIFVGLAIYLFSIDKRVSKLEK